jgi:hypothetical protein
LHQISQSVAQTNIIKEIKGETQKDIKEKDERKRRKQSRKKLRDWHRIVVKSSSKQFEIDLETLNSNIGFLK